MLDICTIGHLSMDKVVTAQSTKYLPGGTSLYFSKVMVHSDLNYQLITALAEQDYQPIHELRDAGVDVYVLPSSRTVYFENIYSATQNSRKQYVSQKAAPFRMSQMPATTAKVFHLGPLLNDDIPLEMIGYLSTLGMVSLDIQGYLRHVSDRKVMYSDWPDKKTALPYVSILKANEFEMKIVTGKTDAVEGAKYLADLGVRDVIITCGSKGSIIYKNGVCYKIRAFKPNAIIDTTGCGDTYMAGYLWQYCKGAEVQEAGEFGAALATLKIGTFGPIQGPSSKILDMLEKSISLSK